MRSWAELELVAPEITALGRDYFEVLAERVAYHRYGDEGTVLRWPARP
jgi:hypothetical protein